MGTLAQAGNHGNKYILYYSLFCILQPSAVNQTHCKNNYFVSVKYSQPVQLPLPCGLLLGSTLITRIVHLRYGGEAYLCQ